MATNTFDRRIELNTTESVKKLMEVMQEDAPVKLCHNILFLQWKGKKQSLFYVSF